MTNAKHKLRMISSKGINKFPVSFNDLSDKIGFHNDSFKVNGAPLLDNAFFLHLISHSGTVQVNGPAAIEREPESSAIKDPIYQSHRLE